MAIKKQSLKRIKHNYRVCIKKAERFLKRKTLLGFVLLFAIAGVSLLIGSHALSPVVNVEPEQGSLRSPAITCADTTSTSGGCVDFASIKPPLTGIIDQHNIPQTSYQPAVTSYDVYVPWSNTQPTNGNSIAPNNVIDKAIQANPQGMRIKLLLEAGQYAPNWAKYLGKENDPTYVPPTICNDKGATLKCGTMPRFWDSGYQNAYTNYMKLLAAQYDNNPAIAQVDIAGCMTIYDEPFIREATPASNTSEYQRTGFTLAGDQQCEKSQIDAHKYWVHTPSYLALNPYQSWTGSGFNTNEDFTEQLIDYCRDPKELGNRCVLGNDSIGKNLTYYTCADITNASKWPTLADYGRMYTKMACSGAPIALLSATPTKIQNSGNTEACIVQWAIGLGAQSVEPPKGYDDPTDTTGTYMTVAQIAGFDTQFAANTTSSSLLPYNGCSV